MKKVLFKDYFFGNKISEHGRERGYVDYKAFSEAFDSVWTSNIIEKTKGIGYWEIENGFIDNTEEIEELEMHIEELYIELEETLSDEEKENLEEEIEDCSEQIDRLSEEQNTEIFQYRIVDERGAALIKEYTNESLLYNDELNMYVWGVPLYGGHWEDACTNIPCEKK